MSIPRNWRLQTQRYRLIGEMCEECGASIFPPRDVCPECEAPVRAPLVFGGQDEVHSHSTVLNLSQGIKEFAPYTVALTWLEESPMVTVQLASVDVDQVRGQWRR